MSKAVGLIKTNASNPKVWVVIGITVAGIVVMASVHRRRLNNRAMKLKDFGSFIDRFELTPFPQLPPPAAKQTLSGLTFAIADFFDVKGYVTGYGNPHWKKTHEAAQKTAVVVTALLKDGATCVGRTVIDEFGFGLTGENKYYETPINPQMPSHVSGGSSSGSAAAVAAEIVDFALGIDTTGGVRIPASCCGIFGFRPSQGAVCAVGVVPSSQSLDTVGWFARDPSVLHRVGHVLLDLKALECRRPRRLIFSDDLFELSTFPKQKTLNVVSKAVEKLPGYHTPIHMNLSQYIASNVPSLKMFFEEPTNVQNVASTMKAVSSVMLSLQRYEFKTNHQEWIQSAKTKMGPGISSFAQSASNNNYENVKVLYKVRTEIRAALQSFLKDDGVLVFPMVADPPPKLKSKQGCLKEFHDRAYALSSIASMSGCCQAAVPLGKHGASPISVSFLSYHGADKFLLDMVLDLYDSLQEQIHVAANAVPMPDTNGNMETSELLKEKGNAAFKGKQWNKAVKYYNEAIKLNEENATYYSNRAAAYLQLGSFQQAEEDSSKAISLDKKNVKAYLRRGTARESLLRYKEAAADFKHASVLEPHNKVAKLAETRLRRLMS